MVMPRSRSRSMPSRTWSDISRCDSAPVSSRIRSDRVVLPWSMWAMMQKLRMSRESMRGSSELQGGIGVEGQVGGLAAPELSPADLGDHRGVVAGEGRADRVALETFLARLFGDAGAQQRVTRHAPRQTDRAGPVAAGDGHHALHHELHHRRLERSQQVAGLLIRLAGREAADETARLGVTQNRRLEPAEREVRSEERRVGKE